MTGTTSVLASAAVGSLLVVGIPSASPAQQSAARAVSSPIARLTSTAAPGSITGVVRDDRGIAVPRVVVSALGAVTTVTLTDASGRFDFGALTPGPYLVRAHLAGYVAPRAVRNDGLQAQEDKSVVAFAVTLDPAKAPSGKVFMLWRVLPAGADPKDKKIAPLFENFSTVTLEGPTPFIGRLFLAPAGKVDVFVAMHELVPDKGSKAPVSVLKQTVDVPALKGGEFMFSSLFVFRARKYPAPLTDILEHPYGTPEEENLPIANPTLSKTENLRVSGMLFNATGRVSIEYVAYKEGVAEPFKKWAAADIDTTKQGIPDSVPLTDFAPGAYRLEIKATDKGSNKTLTESLKFVVGS